MRGVKGLCWLIVHLKLSTDRHSRWLARCPQADQMETSLWSISASRSLVRQTKKGSWSNICQSSPFGLERTYCWHCSGDVLLTRCVIWAGSGVWAAGLPTAAGGKWSLRCPAASDWDPSPSARLSWHVQTPWTSMYCKIKKIFFYYQHHQQDSLIFWHSQPAGGSLKPLCLEFSFWL